MQLSAFSVGRTLQSGRRSSLLYKHAVCKHSAFPLVFHVPRMLVENIFPCASAPRHASGAGHELKNIDVNF